MADNSVRIIIEVSNEAPLEVDLEPGSYVLGRDEDCELFVENDGISRRHARLTVSDSGVTAEDLGSSNGSFLNGEAVTGPVAWGPDSSFVLGADAVTLRLLAPPWTEPSAGTLAPAAPADAMPEPNASTPVNLFETNYSIRNEIARGGMGSVSEADDFNTGRVVAIKQMLSEGSISEESQHRFLQEARVMGHLEHPNIVPMHELGLNENGLPYYTMKRIQGTNLQDVLNQIKAGAEETIAAYPLRTLLGIFLKVCDAMAFAHAKGVIHRDLKPENIMLGEFGEVLVADWGLAKILPRTPLAFLHLAVEEGTEITENEVSEDGSFKTMEGSIMGTPNYMAPEQAEGRTADIDRRSDIFSLGGILYSILTLRPPVLGKTVREVLDNMKSAYIAPPVLYNKVTSAKLIGRGKRAEEEVLLRHCTDMKVPDALSRVAMHAMELEQSARYQKVQELQQDIEAWQLGYATSAEEATFWRQVGLLVARNKAATIVGALVFLIGASLLGWAVFADQKAQAAMAEMKTAVPLIEGELQATIDSGQFDRALARLNSLITLLPGNPEYRRQRARVYQSLFQFDQAAEEFAAAGQLAGDEEKYVDDVTFSLELAGNQSTNGLDDLSFEQFVNRLDREKRFAEARIHRAERITKGRARIAEIAPQAVALADERQLLLQTAVYVDGIPAAPVKAFAHWDFEFDGRDRGGNLDLIPRVGAKIEGGALILDGENGYAVSETHPEALSEFTLEIWAASGLRSDGPATLAAIRQRQPQAYDALRYNLRDDRSLAFQRFGKRQGHTVIGQSVTPKPTEVTQYVLTVGGEGIGIYFNGTNSFQQDGARTRQTFRDWPEDAWTVVLGHTGRTPNKNRIAGRIEEARLFRRVLTSAEVAALYAANPLAHPRESLLARLDAEARERLAAIDVQLDEIKGETKLLNRLTSVENSEAMLRSYRQLMRESDAPAEAADQLSFRYDGALTLNLPSQGISNISWLRNIPLSILKLRGNPIADLSPVRGMPLKELDIADTRVSRLDPLAGMQLERLWAYQAAIADISALRGIPLKLLDLNHNQVADLSPLKGAPLEILRIVSAPVRDLTPLAGMPLRQLSLGDIRGITNLTALTGMPLERLELWGGYNVKDLSPLEGMRLRHLTANEMSGASGWEALRGQPLELLYADSGSLDDFSILSGMPLKKLGLSGTKGTDFSPLREFALRELRVKWTRLSQLADIGGTNHHFIDLQGTPISDLSPLKGRSINFLYLKNCAEIKDVRPLLECRVRHLVAPPNAGDTLAALRNHPTLTHIAWNLPQWEPWSTRCWNDVPSKEEFWRAWDEGKRSP